MTTRVLLADDHPIVLDGLAALLKESAFEVVGRCANGAEVLEALPTAQPDVVILDIQMPKVDGIGVLRTMKEQQHPARVVLLTASLDNSQIATAVELNVDGLVLKETAAQKLLKCIDAVASGQQWIDNEALRRAVQDLARRDARPRPNLTQRELDVARHVAQGLRNRDIAAAMSLTEGTVKMHLHNIYEKIGVQSRTELAIYVRENGLA